MTAILLTRSVSWVDVAMATFAAVTRLHVGYESHGRGYAERRRTDPRIAARIPRRSGMPARW